MGANGIVLAEEGHFVTLIAANDQGAATSSEVFSMENWSHATILCVKGGGSAVTVTLENCTAFSGAGHATMDFSYYAENTASGDTLGARTAATTAGVALSTNTGTMLIIEVDADELPDGSPFLRVKHDTVANSDISITAILSGGRYQQGITSTVIV